MPTSTVLAENSTFFENVLTVRFIAEFLTFMAAREEPFMPTVLRSDVDASGIDVTLAFRGITRHLQLKARSGEKSSKPYDIHESLSGLPGGGILWIRYSAKTLLPTSYDFLGHRGNDPMHDLTGFDPAIKRKKNEDGTVILRKNYRRVKMSSANHKDLQIPELCAILFNLDISDSNS